MVIFAENDSCQSGKPCLQFSATREECLLDALKCIFCALPKRRSSRVVGEGTKRERATGITRKLSSIYSHVSAE